MIYLGDKFAALNILLLIVLFGTRISYPTVGMLSCLMSLIFVATLFWSVQVPVETASGFCLGGKHAFRKREAGHMGVQKVIQITAGRSE